MDNKKVKTSPAAASTAQTPKVQKAFFAFSKENYIIMLIGLALILVGFLLMIGGDSKDPNVFSYDIFNFQRLTLAPILVLAGYVVEIYAIMKKPKTEE